MKVKVYLELTLSKYRRAGGRESLVELPAGAVVRDVLEYFYIPEAEHVLIVKNGRAAGPDESLSPADELVILPLMDGG